MSEDEKKYKYKFSVVIPVYKVEKYLEETIESIINQDIGFKENIQMILVNDGSPDNSEEICLKYRDMFPNNIIYIKQENAGVSAARNNGKKYVEGKYTNFLDSDDKWELDAFSKVWEFFEKNYKKTNLVSCRMKYFDARDDYHTLDYKFDDENSIIDILEDYDLIQLHITSSFVKSEILDLYEFDTRLKYAEDSKFIGQIIIDRRQYGVLSNTIHYYRKRIDESSAVQNKENSREWYFDTPEYMYKEIIKQSIEKYGYIIPYVQYMIMYDLQWRLKEKIPDILDDKEKEAYINTIKQLLNCIDDYIICGQKNLVSEYKCYALSLKYGRDIRKELVYRKSKLYFNNMFIYNLKNIALFTIEILDIDPRKKEMQIEGIVNCILPREDYKIYVLASDGNKYKMSFKDLEITNKECLDGTLLKKRKYKVRLPLDQGLEYRFIIAYNKIFKRRLTLTFKKFSKLNENVKNSYYSKGKYIVSTKSNKIIVEKKEKGLIRKKEKAYLKSLREIKRNDIVFYRIMYKIYRKFIKKDIWLLCDKLPNRSDDNAKFLFKYIAKRKNQKIKPIYIVSKDNKEYKELKKFGKVIKPYSFKHKLYFLLCKRYISSHIIDDNINPFKEDIKYLRDLYNSKFVFLQHGITKDDISKGTNRFAKNVAIFVTCTRQEYESIINGNYSYSKKEVKLTGFPRYDELYNRENKNKNKNKNKYILIMPTWRKNLKDTYDNKTYESVYSENFKETDFYKFYNSLINDTRILKVLENNGFKMKFCLHPIMQTQYVDFEGNDYVEINSNAIDYSKEFAECSALVTDFSSVAFDVAYLRKPIIYTQFDYEDFFDEGQYEEGYFEYNRDGFGPVCYDYEKSVQEIIKAIENNCKIEEKYEERINNCYAYHDNKNCERVYKEILKLK